MWRLVDELFPADSDIKDKIKAKFERIKTVDDMLADSYTSENQILVMEMMEGQSLVLSPSILK